MLIIPHFNAFVKLNCKILAFFSFICYNFSQLTSFKQRRIPYFTASVAFFMLKPEFLKQLHLYSIRAQRRFRGTLKGERSSLNRGTGIEFADYRAYELGDDLRYVDWNVYARLEKPFIKLFQADEELPVSLLIDNSRSMQFGNPTKLTCAKQLAAALAYIAVAHNDSVAVYQFAERLVSALPPTSGTAQFSRITKALSAIDAQAGIEGTRITDCLRHLATHQPWPGVAVIFSDFFAADGYASGFKLLAGRGFSLMAIQLMSPEETDPSHTSTVTHGNQWQLEDAETGETRAITMNEETLAQYRHEHKAFCDDLQRFCAKRGIGYARFNCGMPIETFVLQELHRVGFLQRKR